MLNGIRIYSTDNIWRTVLSGLGATIASAPDTADINIDSLTIMDAVSPMELKSIILKEIDASQKKVMQKLFGKTVVLPYQQMQIIMLLFKTGGMSAGELKNVLGYSSDTTTHTIDTAIYNLRRVYGRDFIKNENGKYLLGL